MSDFCPWIKLIPRNTVKNSKRENDWEENVMNSRKVKFEVLMLKPGVVQKVISREKGKLELQGQIPAQKKKCNILICSDCPNNSCYDILPYDISPIVYRQIFSNQLSGSGEKALICGVCQIL